MTRAAGPQDVVGPDGQGNAARDRRSSLGLALLAVAIAHFLVMAQALRPMPLFEALKCGLLFTAICPAVYRGSRAVAGVLIVLGGLALLAVQFDVGGESPMLVGLGLVGGVLAVLYLLGFFVPPLLVALAIYAATSSTALTGQALILVTVIWILLMRYVSAIVMALFACAVGWHLSFTLGTGFSLEGELGPLLTGAGQGRGLKDALDFLIKIADYAGLNQVPRLVVVWCVVCAVALTRRKTDDDQ